MSKIDFFLVPRRPTIEMKEGTVLSNVVTKQGKFKSRWYAIPQEWIKSSRQCFLVTLLPSLRVELAVFSNICVSLTFLVVSIPFR